MVPAVPVETPNPVIPFSVTNSPGTCSDKTGNKADSLLLSIFSRLMTDIVNGTELRFTSMRLAETTKLLSLIKLSTSIGSMACAEWNAITPVIIKMFLFKCLFILMRV